MATYPDENDSVTYICKMYQAAIDLFHAATQAAEYGKLTGVLTLGADGSVSSTLTDEMLEGNNEQLKALTVTANGETHTGAAALAHVSGTVLALIGAVPDAYTLYMHKARRAAQ